LYKDSGKKWKRYVFPGLVLRRKWALDRRPIKLGDIAVIQDNNVIRGDWTLGRVMQVFPGADGQVRNVEVNQTWTV
jgi:hypothetical protein